VTEQSIRAKAEELIAEKLAEKVAEMISQEGLGASDRFQEKLVDFFVDNLRITL
jgi:hypothetical protein